jgi:hypothetical protein
MRSTAKWSRLGGLTSISVWLGISIKKYFPHLPLGANPSAEEGEEALEDAVVQVIDVVDNFRLQKTTFDKKSFLTYLKVRSDLCPIDLT